MGSKQSSESSSKLFNQEPLKPLDPVTDADQIKFEQLLTVLVLIKQFGTHGFFGSSKKQSISLDSLSREFVRNQIQTSLIQTEYVDKINTLLPNRLIQDLHIPIVLPFDQAKEFETNSDYYLAMVEEKIKLFKSLSQDAITDVIIKSVTSSSIISKNELIMFLLTDEKLLDSYSSARFKKNKDLTTFESKITYLKSLDKFGIHGAIEYISLTKILKEKLCSDITFARNYIYQLIQNLTKENFSDSIFKNTYYWNSKKDKNSSTNTKDKNSSTNNKVLKQYKLSPELLAFLDKPLGTVMSSHQVTREVYNYIKTNNLVVGSENKRYCNLDEKLTTIIKLNSDEKLSVFNFQNCLKHNFIEVVGVVEVVDDDNDDDDDDNDDDDDDDDYDYDNDDDNDNDNDDDDDDDNDDNLIVSSLKSIEKFHEEKYYREVYSKAHPEKVKYDYYLNFADYWTLFQLDPVLVTEIIEYSFLVDDYTFSEYKYSWDFLDSLNPRVKQNIITKHNSDRDRVLENRYGLIASLEDLVDIAIFCQFPPTFLRPENDGTEYYDENAQVLFKLLESYGWNMNKLDYLNWDLVISYNLVRK